MQLGPKLSNLLFIWPLCTRSFVAVYCRQVIKFRATAAPQTSHSEPFRGVRRAGSLSKPVKPLHAAVNWREHNNSIRLNRQLHNSPFNLVDLAPANLKRRQSGENELCWAAAGYDRLLAMSAGRESWACSHQTVHGTPAGGGDGPTVVSASSRFTMTYSIVTRLICDCPSGASGGINPGWLAVWLFVRGARRSQRSSMCGDKTPKLNTISQRRDNGPARRGRATANLTIIIMCMTTRWQCNAWTGKQASRGVPSHGQSLDR